MTSESTRFLGQPRETNPTLSFGASAMFSAGVSRMVELLTTAYFSRFGAGFCAQVLSKRCTDFNAEDAKKASRARRVCGTVFSMLKLIIILGLLVGAGTASAQTKAKPLKFDVVSIKLNRSGEPRGILQISPDGDRIIVTNAPMTRIVQFAFNFLRNDLVVGDPDWARTERWDIEAKVAESDVPAFHQLDFVQKKAMLQQVLIERCGMQAKVEKREIPVYALVVAKSGLKMHKVQPNEMPPVVHDKSGQVVSEWEITQKPGEIHGRAVPMEALMYVMSNVKLGRQIVDHTGLKAIYNFDLLWTPEEGSTLTENGLPDTTRPSIFTAVQEQLGLRLDATKDMVDALVISHIERPTED
jgi:uncharacterized protein (TIGR03435 family)